MENNSDLYSFLCLHQAPEPQVEHSNYTTVDRSMSHDSYDRSKDYGDYSTAQHVQLQAQDEPAGDSWV